MYVWDSIRKMRLESQSNTYSKPNTMITLENFTQFLPDGTPAGVFTVHLLDNGQVAVEDYPNLHGYFSIGKNELVVTISNLGHQEGNPAPQSATIYFGTGTPETIPVVHWKGSAYGTGIGQDGFTELTLSASQPLIVPEKQS